MDNILDKTFNSLGIIGRLGEYYLSTLPKAPHTSYTANQLRVRHIKKKVKARKIVKTKKGKR
jgi:hypothetical protein